MIKLLLFLAICDHILSEPMFVLSVQEKIMPNVEEGDLLPLIVKPTVDVTEETKIICNGNIRYRYANGSNPDLGDEETLTKIPAGTKAGTIIKFNCVIYYEIKDSTVTFELDRSMTDWSWDDNNKKIRFTANYEAEKASEKSSEDKGEEEKSDSRNIKIVWKFMMALLILLF